MDNFELPRLFADRPTGHNYLEDELYYVVGGQGTIRVGPEDRPVTPGTAVFVPAGVEHHFHSITAELRILVVFAPAETPTAA